MTAALQGIVSRRWGPKWWPNAGAQDRVNKESLHLELCYAGFASTLLALKLICALLLSGRRYEVSEKDSHLDGHAEQTGPDNLIWNCRACNTRLGVVFKRPGLGRPHPSSTRPQRLSRNSTIAAGLPSQHAEAFRYGGFEPERVALPGELG